ncbi:MAG: right-handed parallel beta-helix repeat-containing protein [Candidatus Brocadiia bacterium]
MPRRSSSCGAAALVLASVAFSAPRGPVPVDARVAVRLADGSAFIDAEKALRRAFGSDLARLRQQEVSTAIVALAESLPPGGAIDLPRSVPCGMLDFRQVAPRVQITGGHGGRLLLGAGQSGSQLVLVGLDVYIQPPRVDFPLLAARNFQDVRLFDDVGPASDLLALFCTGAIHIDHDIRNCAWLCGNNAFGRKTVTANARVDDCLFLWFGINWAFADYNAHFAQPQRNWLDNAQMWMDCKGGGQGTRMYLMVETNYGNPGPGVVLENCKGMALYHGATERGSAQGPGVYWLRNCEGVQLGLRRIFSATRGGPKGAVPSHDITIEGGRGNILHVFSGFGNAQEASCVNSDPQLQLWCVSFDFEARGTKGDDILAYCFTPFANKPTGATLERVKERLDQAVARKLRDHHIPDTPANRERVAELLRSGRDLWAPINARHEETFRYGGVDLTEGVQELPGGRKLPPPPSMPPTDAPRLRRPIAFTQAPDFGKALLEAGADPTGQRPSDDAFARLMYGMTRDELDALLAEAAQADADFRAARARKNKQAMQAARAVIDRVVDALHPRVEGSTKNRVKRPRIEVPQGTFLVTKPIFMLGYGSIWGAGPEKTVLKAAPEVPKVIEQHTRGTVANFAVDGGRVGIAITGADHNDHVSPTLASYIAGENYYNITFRNQSFAGIHIGNDEPGVLGGSEFDQNKFVDLRFHNTGDYGIYINNGMLDKWLCLHCEFVGQRKCGIWIKFNNLIHGGVIGCTFKDIDGPGLDFMGGNPFLAFRPYVTMVDQCEFIECGNAQRPAVDFGNGELTSFTRTAITTEGKAIHGGYVGGAQHYEDVTVRARLVDGAPAMAFRAVRQGQTARANGHILRNVRCPGPVAFINDANAHNDVFEKTMAKAGKSAQVDWDTNAAAHELAPPNGWVHPFLLYQCELGGKSYEYTLLNVDTDQGKVVEETDLSRLAR